MCRPDFLCRERWRTSLDQETRLAHRPTTLGIEQATLSPPIRKIDTVQLLFDPRQTAAATLGRRHFGMR